MKKFFFFAAALIGLLAVSCNKEKEAPVAPVTAGKHPVSIKAAIAPGTRTSYENDKTFSWKAGDVIFVMTYSEADGYLRLEEFTAESDGPETIFTGEVEDGYGLYGNAFYTAKDSYVAFGGEDDGNIYLNFPSFTYVDGDNEKYYTVDSNNPLMNLPLTGYKGEDDDTYVFQTAAGAVKFTFEDIPEGAAYIALDGSSNYLSGQFAFDETGVLNMEDFRRGSYESNGNTYSYASRYVIYHFERNADGSGSIYMPLPVGEIPAGTGLYFYDEELENVLYSRTIRSDIPIERNKVTEVASFSATTEWESLGEGAVYDFPLGYYMTSEADRENDDIVYQLAFVEFFRDKNRPGVYRIENPFKQMAEDRGYEIDPEYLEQMDDYLELTVMQDGTISYDAFYTGYKLTSGGESYHAMLANPANFGDDNSFNFVAKVTEDGVPMNAFLSGFYVFERNGGYALWSWSDSWSYMWTILLFPDAEEQLDLNCSIDFEEIADDDPAHPTANVSLKLGEDLVGAYVVIAQDREAAEEMFAAGKGTFADADGDFIAPFPEDAPSGEYYAYAKTVPADGLTANCSLLFGSENEYDYYRSDLDRQLTLDDVVGAYSGEEYYFTIKQYERSGYGWTSSEQQLTMAIEESDDPLSGDIMFTEIVPELAKAISNRNAEIVPIYGWFDTATGVITIDLNQTACTYRNNYYTVSDNDGKEVSLLLKEDGSIVCKKNIAFLLNGQMNKYGAPEGWTDAGSTFYRANRSAAPAKAPARNQAVTGSGAGHSAPSLVNPFTAKRPTGEMMLYPGRQPLTM